MNEKQQRLHDDIAKKLADDGRLIEIGWQTMLHFVMPKDASPTQVSEMRKAFFMGAQHLYASMMAFLEAGEEPTDTDMNRMSLIHNELEAFRKEVTSFHAGVRT